MRGPAIFLLSLAGAVVVGVALLRPALAERENLRAELKRVAGAGEATPAVVTAARDRLSRELGEGHGAAGRALAGEIAARFAVDESPRNGDGEMSFLTRLDRLSAVLSALEAAAGALDAVDVQAGPRPDRCRIRLVLRAGDR